MDSRIEEILKEKVGDPYEEVPLMSRIEILLDRLGSGSGDSSEYAHSLELTINSQTYVLTATLKNTSGETLGTPQTIDLPLETMVVGGSYDDTTKKVILTLKNGNTVDFSVADLVSGLQTEITSTNKLNSDLVDDTNQNNKFVTSAEKTKIANALTSEEYNAGKTTPSGTTYTIDGTTYTVGDNAEVFNDYIGNRVAGSYSHAEGINTKALYNLAHAEGSETTASNVASHAEGGFTTASGEYSHAEGVETTASDAASHAEGAHTIASGAYSHAEGERTIASSTHQHVQGKYNVQDSNGKYAFIIGNGTNNENRSNAFAIDWGGLIYVNNASTGVNVSQLLTEETYNAGKTVKKGTTFVIDEVTYTVGDNAETFNNYSINKVAGNYSHAEGSGTTASHSWSHAEGNATTASGDGSHAEGNVTTASGNWSHAEGTYTLASVIAAHAEGAFTRATGGYAHAEGNSTNATGGNSHAEGNNTIASGSSSHAEGSYAKATKKASHAEGTSTIAASDNQHTQGKYNIEDSSGKYAFIIGNGTDNDNRSNAFAVDWEGKIYVNNSATGVDVSDLLARIIVLENKVAALENT